MSNITGEVSWTDTVSGAAEKRDGKDTFLRLAKGSSNIVRILTLPHQYYQHKYMVEGGNKYGYRVNCAGTGCPLCAKGDKPKRRWFLGVIDRKTNSYRVLDIGYSVFKSIQGFAKDDDWGLPDQYDIDIVADAVPSPDMYRAVCKPKKPLSTSDLALREQNDPEDLVRRTAPPTVEKVQERLNNIHAEIGGNSNTSASNASSDEEGGDDYFKDVEGKSSNGHSRSVSF